MGRTSDYTKQVRNEEYENSVETTKKSAKSFADIKRMFAKEPMTAEQFGIYLGGCKAAGDFISDKTIKRYIEKLCKMSDGKITASKFMKTVDGTEVYIIQPEIQELLVAMFDTDFFGAKGKPKAGIDVKQRLRAQLAENVEIYLDESVKKQVKSAPQFLNARLEDILTEKINNEVRGMFATMKDSDDTIQYQLMLVDLFKNLTTIFECTPEWFFEYFNTKAGDIQNDNEYNLMLKEYKESIKYPEFEYSNVYAIKEVVENVGSNSMIHMAINNAIRMTYHEDVASNHQPLL